LLCRPAGLRHDAILQSTGASVRIEGAEVSDAEVAEILGGLHLGSFRSREESEVRGYAELISLFIAQADTLVIDENHLKQYHAILLGHSQRDRRHRGEYKTVPVNITALSPDGTERILLTAATPFDTRRWMPRLLAEFDRALAAGGWHPLALIADFLLWFLTIHPFQDGNGRLARALHTLLLLRAGYEHIAYSSLERVIEQRRPEYYEALRQSQGAVRTDPAGYQRWFEFTLAAMVAQQANVQARLDTHRVGMHLSDVQRAILTLFEGSDSLTTAQLARALSVPARTLRYNLSALVDRGLILREGRRRGTVYRLVSGSPIDGDAVTGDARGGELELRDAPAEPAPADVYRAACDLLTAGDRVAVDRRRRELFHPLLQALQGWMAANATSPRLPEGIRDHDRLESWLPIVDPLLEAVSPHLQRYLALGTAMVEHDSDLLDTVGEDLLLIFEEPARGALLWAEHAPALVARIGCDTLLTRAVWLRRWRSSGLLLRRRIPVAEGEGRAPWPGHPDYQHPKMLGRRPDVAAGMVLHAMIRDGVTHALGIAGDEVATTAADANALTGLLTLATLGSSAPPARFWGFRLGPRRRLLRTLADDPSVIDRLCVAGGVAPAVFRESFARNFDALAAGAEFDAEVMALRQAIAAPPQLATR